MGRAFGQHFLRSTPVLEKIAKAVCPNGPEDHIVEIGSGRGALTRYLLPLAKRLTAIEVDPAMVIYLEQNLPESPQLEIINRDILDVDLNAYAPCVIAGNLPYYISSPIASLVFAANTAWKRAVFLVQLEVAQRMSAPPGSRDYGYLSVLTQVHATARILFQVPPGAFVPAPKVKSAVILLEPKPVDTEWARRFLKFASAAFQHKRKTLRNNLGTLYPKEWIEAEPEANLRGEQLSVEQMADLFARLSNRLPVLS